MKEGASVLALSVSLILCLPSVGPGQSHDHLGKVDFANSCSAAQRAQAAPDQGRRIGTQTQRERDYIDAVAAYYQDFANRPEVARQQSRTTSVRGWRPWRVPVRFS